MNKILFFLIILFSVASCCSRKPISASKTIHDTIRVSEFVKVRDTVFVTKPTGTSIDIPVSKITEIKNPIISKKDNSTLTVRREKDTVFIDCDCDSIKLKAQIRDKIINKDRIRSEVELREVPVKFIPWYIKILAWIGGIFIVVIIGVMIGKSSKLI